MAAKQIKRTERRLTTRQEGFLAAYLADPSDGRAAAIKAGYSPKAANVQASLLLNHPIIHAKLAKLSEKVIRNSELTAEKVIKSINSLIDFDIRKLYDPITGEPIPPHLLSDEAAFGLNGVDIVTNRSGKFIKYRVVDKNKAIEMAGRYFKMFTDRVEHSGDIEIKTVLLPEQPVDPKPTPPTQPTFKPKMLTVKDEDEYL